MSDGTQDEAFFSRVKTLLKEEKKKKHKCRVIVELITKI